MMTAAPPMLAPDARPAWPVVRMLICPVPPSTNNLFANRKGGKGRYKTDAYKAWREEAGWRLNGQRPPKLKGEVKIGFSVPRNNRRDLDNFQKSLLDLLVEMRVIERDNMTCVVGLSIECEQRDDVAIWLRQRGAK